ncbi:Uncharacterised protein [Yersinia intermedia]|nr:Uncharacterised protein [Yersinia intermedia]
MIFNQLVITNAFMLTVGDKNAFTVQLLFVCHCNEANNLLVKEIPTFWCLKLVLYPVS